MVRNELLCHHKIYKRSVINNCNSFFFTYSEMMTLLKVTALCLTLAFAVATPGRQRRFLLDITAVGPDQGEPGSVQGAFSWDFGTGKFVVKDRDAVFQAISDADDVIWDLLGHGIWLEHGAFQFRNHVALYPDDENLDLWKTAAKSMTDLYDAVGSGGRMASDYTVEMENALDTNDQADVFEEALKNCGLAYVRIDRLLPEVKQALTELWETDRAQAWVISMMDSLDGLNKTTREMKEAYQGIIVAAGIASDK